MSARAAPPFPWDETIAFAMGVLHAQPSELWRLTPREIAAAYRGLTGRGGAGEALDRGGLEALMAEFPDG